MAKTKKWTNTTGRETGIAGAAIVAGANFLGSEINNAINKSQLANIEVNFTCAVAPTVNKVIENYLIYAISHTASAVYEDGSVAIDPTTTPIGFVAARAVTSAQRVTIKNIPLMPFRFKILLKSELDQNASGVSVHCYTHGEEL